MLAKKAKQLSESDRAAAKKLLARIRERIRALSRGKKEKIWRMRRYVYLRLLYDERGTSMHRRKLKRMKHAAQNGLCAMCRMDLPLSGAELDRIVQIDGYADKNTRLLCHTCHRKDQERIAYR